MEQFQRLRDGDRYINFFFIISTELFIYLKVDNCMNYLQVLV